MSLCALYFLFMKYGFLCFGGGYVLIPLMIDDFINRRNLITSEAFGNLISIAQLTPGPVGINAATYIGFTQHGVAGAIFASLGVVATSMILAAGASYYVTKWKDSFPVKALLTGIRPAALALIFYAVVLILVMIFTNNPTTRAIANRLIAPVKALFRRKKPTAPEIKGGDSNE